MGIRAALHDYDLLSALAEVWFCQRQIVSATVCCLESWELFRGYIHAGALISGVGPCWSFGGGSGCGWFVIFLNNSLCSHREDKGWEKRNPQSNKDQLQRRNKNY